VTLPLEMELRGAPRARRTWGHLGLPREGAAELPISARSDEPFEPQISQAAAAERLVEEDADGITLWVHVPRGGRKNTEVVWDSKRNKLSVGAWSRRVARQEGRGNLPGRRLLWHSSTWQPAADGARATASIAGGWVRVRLPNARPA
jgi:hypothetical protein